MLRVLLGALIAVSGAAATTLAAEKPEIRIEDLLKLFKTKVADADAIKCTKLEDALELAAITCVEHAVLRAVIGDRSRRLCGGAEPLIDQYSKCAVEQDIGDNREHDKADHQRRSVCKRQPGAKAASSHRVCQPARNDSPRRAQCE